MHSGRIGHHPVWIDELSMMVLLLGLGLARYFRASREFGCPPLFLLVVLATFCVAFLVFCSPEAFRSEITDVKDVEVGEVLTEVTASPGTFGPVRRSLGPKFVGLTPKSGNTTIGR